MGAPERGGAEHHMSAPAKGAHPPEAVAPVREASPATPDQQFSMGSRRSAVARAAGLERDSAQHDMGAPSVDAPQWSMGGPEQASPAVGTELGNFGRFH